MNKIKIMLMAVATFAVIGGALAFKSAKFSVKFCTNSVTYTNFIKPTTIPSTFVGKSVAVGGNLYYYTTTTATTLCPSVLSLASIKTLFTIE